MYILYSISNSQSFASIVSLSVWLTDEATILHCSAQLDVHPLSSLGFVWLSTSLPIVCYSFIALGLVASCQHVVHPAAKQFYPSLDFWDGSEKDAAAVLKLQMCERLWQLLPLLKGTGWTKTGTQAQQCSGVQSNKFLFLLRFARDHSNPSHFLLGPCCSWIIHDSPRRIDFSLSCPHILAGCSATKLDAILLLHLWIDSFCQVFQRAGLSFWIAFRFAGFISRQVTSTPTYEIGVMKG